METNEESSKRLSLLSAIPQLYSLFFGVEDLKRFEITRTQLIILLALERQHMMTMTQISNCILSHKEQVTRIISHMVDEGLVERRSDPENRTHVFARLTDKGMGIVKSFSLSFLANLDSRLSMNLSQEEIQEVLEAFCTIMRLMEKARIG